MSWPTTLEPLSTPPAKLAKLVEEMSDGKFIIEVQGAEKHKAPLEILDMVKNDQFQMGHTSSYYFKGKSSSTALLTTVPFGMNSSEQYAWYYYGGGEALTKKFMILLKLIVIQVEILGYKWVDGLKKRLNHKMTSKG